MLFRSLAPYAHAHRLTSFVSFGFSVFVFVLQAAIASVRLVGATLTVAEKTV